MIYQIIANLYIEDEEVAQQIYALLRNKVSDLSVQKLNGVLEQSNAKLMLNKHLEGEICDTIDSFYLTEDKQVIDGGM